MRTLSAEEQALWARVTATIRPLSRELALAGEASAPDLQQPRKRAIAPVSIHSPAPAASPRPLSAATLDSTWDRKLRSGAIRPDRVVDLHGHSLDRAWQAIDSALEDAIDSGDRVLLLITGHARAGEPPVARGKIRAVVHDWLAASRHASRIAAVRGAHMRHGGGGSLYIILRRR